MIVVLMAGLGLSKDEKYDQFLVLATEGTEDTPSHPDPRFVFPNPAPLFGSHKEQNNKVGWEEPRPLCVLWALCG